MGKLSAIQSLIINIVLGFLIIVGIDWTFRHSLELRNETLSYQHLNSETRFKVTQSLSLFQIWLMGSEKINVNDQIFFELQSIQKELQHAIEGKESKYFADAKYNVPDDELNSKIKNVYANINSISEIILSKYNYQIVNQKRHRKETLRDEEMEKKFSENFERISKELQLAFLEIDNTIILISQRKSTYTNIFRIVLLFMSSGFLLYLTFLIYKNKLAQQKSSERLKHLVENETNRMEKLTTFIDNIKNNNFNHQLDIDISKDGFARAVVELKQKLQESDEEERKQSLESKKRNWITQGVAWASDVLRESYKDVEDLSYSIISGLVKYMEANQGGVFILNEEDESHPFLELTGAYAFEQRKFITKHIEIGEGLVGMCFQEGKTTYIKEVPSDYIKITSGLGESSPQVLILVPLIFNDKCYGVIEIASFTEIEKHQIEFLENVCETIASTISSARINQRTAYLLEQSKHQAESMKAQEEEMRQNLEEMQATQEEASRREAELKSMLMAVDFSNIVVEYNLDGNIILANDAFANAINKPINMIVGDNHKNYSQLFQEDRDEYLRFWNKLLNGERQKIVSEIENDNGLKITLLEAYSPIFDQNNHVVKIVNYATVVNGEKV